MSVDIQVPAVGESVREVQIGRWLKSEGDRIEKDEVLVELETDKASMELPSPASGQLSRILKKEGETASVGEAIAQVEEGGPQEGDGHRATQRSVGASKKSVEQGENAESGEAATAESSGRSNARGGEKKTGPKTQKASSGLKGSEEEQSGAASSEGGGGGAPPEEIEVRPRVMPAERAALAQRHLRPQDVKGTGHGGRILVEDVERQTTRRSAAGSPDDGAAEQGGRERIVPMSMLRRRIAQRLVEAQQTAALLTTFNEVDMQPVQQFREERGKPFQEQYGVKLGIMSFFVKAAVEALRRVPQVNAEVRGTDIVYKAFYDIGVAVAIEEGLVVPVLRGADQMSVAEVERRIAALAERARRRKITPDELRGGSFTITNGGVFGSLLSTPIVNPPESAILGLHAIQDRPVAREGQIVIRPMMYLALTYDHRIIDGREAVLFLRHVKELIESPIHLLFLA